MRNRSTLALLGFFGVTAAVAVAGSFATRPALSSFWYARLRKPRFQPPGAVFGPVWTGLYALMSVSAWRVWRAPASPERTRALALWGAQLTVNGAWSWLFFAARSPRAGLADLALLVPTTLGYLTQARKVDRHAASLMAPYAAWLLFATALNADIVRKNG